MRLAHYLALFMLGGLQLSCATLASDQCGVLEPLQAPAPEVDLPSDLQTALARIIDAHCNCRFPAEVRARVPLGSDDRGSWETAEGPACLGPLAVAEWSVEASDLVAVQVVQRGSSLKDRSKRYLLICHVVGGQWLFSWPARMGPEIEGPL
jgi:hypothetical protein